MILTRKEVLREIHAGRIKVTPFFAKNIGPTSLDLTLSNEFRSFHPFQKISVSENTDYKKLTQKRKVRELVLEPGAFVLGITKENIQLPDDIAGILSGRSRFARLGILVHATAAFVHPGVNNHQVLEITNVSQNTLVLKPGTKIAQLVFVRTEGKAMYQGKFQRQ
ncbi:MAG TPA: dCTP deaminase [Candidatus Nanoarchaeia archaeon]|nr:dCTP deaminase [Candidatus Nanoarchaeia archaeon]